MTSPRRLRARLVYGPRAALVVSAALTVAGVVEAVTLTPITGALDAVTGAALFAAWAYIARAKATAYRLITTGKCK